MRRAFPHRAPVDTEGGRLLTGTPTEGCTSAAPLLITQGVQCSAVSTQLSNALGLRTDSSLLQDRAAIKPWAVHGNRVAIKVHARPK